MEVNRISRLDAEWVDRRDNRLDRSSVGVPADKIIQIYGCCSCRG
jgi:hypothetical protein